MVPVAFQFLKLVLIQGVEVADTTSYQKPQPHCTEDDQLAGNKVSPEAAAAATEGQNAFGQGVAGQGDGDDQRCEEIEGTIALMRC